MSTVWLQVGSDIIAYFTDALSKLMCKPNPAECICTRAKEIYRHPQTMTMMSLPTSECIHCIVADNFSGNETATPASFSHKRSVK